MAISTARFNHQRARRAAETPRDGDHERVAPVSITSEPEGPLKQESREVPEVAIVVSITSEPEGPLKLLTTNNTTSPTKFQSPASPKAR